MQGRRPILDNDPVEEGKWELAKPRGERAAADAPGRSSVLGAAGR